MSGSASRSTISGPATPAWRRSIACRSTDQDRQDLHYHHRESEQTAAIVNTIAGLGTSSTCRSRQKASSQSRSGTRLPTSVARKRRDGCSAGRSRREAVRNFLAMDGGGDSVPKEADADKKGPKKARSRLVISQGGFRLNAGSSACSDRGCREDGFAVDVSGRRIDGRSDSPSPRRRSRSRRGSWSGQTICV
jgi:hypothetical protein